MKFVIPGKTFLLGEYSALVGGSVIGLATAPGFSANYESAVATEFPFSEQSPSGFLWNSTKEHFQKKKIILKDGYNGAGGFGKSTAEYLSILAPTLVKNPNSFNDIESDYKAHSKASGAESSGKDLAIQYFGQVMTYDRNTNVHSSDPWKFADLEFFLISTGMKVPTHEHLQTLNLKTLTDFTSISNAGITAYKQGSTSDFISGLKMWSSFLDSRGFLAKTSKEIKTDLEQDSDILCAKPCGAMGADVILVLCDREKKHLVRKKLFEKKFIIQGCSDDLIAGVQSQLFAELKSSGDLHVD